MNKIYQWGIVGTGNIANQMAQALQVLDNAQIISVLSRTTSRAKHFATKHNIANVFTKKEDFISKEKPDIVYIATPHPAHLEYAIYCLNNNIPVLFEKPMTVNATDTNNVIEAARRTNTFLMEGMWSPFFPAYKKAIELIHNGTIGDIKHIDAKFSFRGPWAPKERLLNPELGGGALLDVGIYVLYFAILMTKQHPIEKISMAHIGTTGVDEESNYLLKFKNGVSANLMSGIQTETEHNAYIYGSKGYIKLPTFWQADECILHQDDKTQNFTFERLGNGYTYEAMHVMSCLNQQYKESNILPLDQTLYIAKLMDSFRSDWKLKYPFETN